MSTTPDNTVKRTGADAGDILVGISAKHNLGLLVKIFDHQQKDEGGRIVGEFTILHEGSGTYSEGIRKTLVSKASFRNADEFILAVARQDGCADCTHVLNANSFWKLDVGAIRTSILETD